MITAQPPPKTTKPTRTNPSVSVPQDNRKPADFSPTATTVSPPKYIPTVKMVHPSEIGDYNEEREITLMLLSMVLVLVVPAMLMMVYFIINPNAFMIDITPKYDISNWQLGQRPQLMN